MGYDIIVIGASVGGVEALSQLVKDLPSNLPAAVFAVLHVPSTVTSAMPSILNRVGSLKAVHPQDRDPIQQGYIYVAPPNYHLLVKQGYIRLVQGPKENSCRPAIDPLFRTAARAYGRRVVGVVLTGMLDDGSAGLLAVKNQGGLAIVQSPDDALFSGMPQNAIDRVPVDHILPLSEIAAALVELASQPISEKAAPEQPVSVQMESESDIAEFSMAAIEDESNRGKPSGFGCPSCGGALWETQEADFLRFRCRIGHAWSESSLLAEQSNALEEALWVALRALEERVAMSLRLAARASDRNQSRMLARYEEEAKDLKRQAELIQQLILQLKFAGDRD